MDERWFVLRLNPEPWRVPPMSAGRRQGKLYVNVGRDDQLHAFKEAVRESLGTQPMQSGWVCLTFYLWRARLDYETPQARTHRKHEADATNLQKSLEDALQGVLFANDKNVRDIRTVVVEQEPNIEPAIVIRIREWTAQNPDEIPEHVWELARKPMLFVPPTPHNYDDGKDYF